MAAYHSSFTYLDQNSADKGYIITSFEPDNGFVDTFLSMDQVYEDYYDGTKKFLYGTRYNNTATIHVTLVKADGTDWSLLDNRRALKWLTGARTASWLDLYQGDKIKYSFLGTVTSPQQYKLDGRVIGISFDFASITPWAYSQEQVFDRSISQSLYMDGDVLVAKEISVSEDGVLCNSAVPSVGGCYCINEDGVVYVESEKIVAVINNETDDLYSYIYLDIEFTNESCTSLKLINETLGETTSVEDLGKDDIIYITGKQFITKYTRDQLTGELVNTNHIFGDSFNFVWPRLAPGINSFMIEGGGNGSVRFSYRYPMKVGDCAMDISTYGGDVICGSCDEIPSYDTVRWQDITGIPNTLAGYGITNAYTDSEIDSALANVSVKWENVENTPTTVEGYKITDAYTTSEVYTKAEVDDKIEDIEISGGGTVDGSVAIDEDKLNEMLGDILI